MESKHWYASKTLWVNFLAIVAIILNSQFGIELDVEVQAALATSILAIINIVLRFVTSQPISK